MSVLVADSGPLPIFVLVILAIVALIWFATKDSRTSQGRSSGDQDKTQNTARYSARHEAMYQRTEESESFIQLQSVSRQVATQQRFLNKPLDSLSGQEFEVLVGKLFQSDGWQVRQTPKGADSGVDLVAKKDSVSVVVQCKRWKGRIGEPVIRDVLGAMIHAKADEAYVVTTNYFTRSARLFASGKKIHLISHVKLDTWLERSRSQRLQDETIEVSSDIEDGVVAIDAVGQNRRLHVSHLNREESGNDWD